MKFIASPEPLQGESRASWIQRVCGAHGYSMTRFCECVGVNRNRVDWDFGVDEVRWKWIVKNSGHGGDGFKRNDADWAFASQRYGGKVSPLFINKKPASKWCWACLEADSTPYFRWYWRMAELQTCPYHDVALSKECSWCGAFVNLSSASLVPWGGLRGTASLAGCASCGMPFLGGGPSEPSFGTGSLCAGLPVLDPINALREALNRRAVPSWMNTRKNSTTSPPASPHMQESRDESEVRMKQANAIQEFSTPRPYGLLKLNVHVPDPSKREVGAAMLKIERERVLGTNFNLISVLRSPFSSKPLRRTYFWSPSEWTKWSALLAPPARVRLAKAMLVIRREKALQRSEARDGLDEEGA